MTSSFSYENRPPKYKKFSEQEWNLKNAFSYDDHKGFSDLKILKMQNDHRFSYMEEKYGLPSASLLGFCTDFSMDNKRNRLIQRHLCPNNCFWNPQPCFGDQSHSGNLADLMRKSFHDNFNPPFKSQFKRNNAIKIDWSLTGGVGYYPSQGLKKLIEDLGISSKLCYDYEGYAINFNNLSREFRVSDPVRPLYVMEEKKCHDIIEALLNVNSDRVERSRKEMQNIYDESYHSGGLLRKPILSLMMWGPAVNLEMQNTGQKCDFRNFYNKAGSHVCGNFSEKHYWMYSHGDKVKCNIGSIKNLRGPAMTLDMKVIYPCNNSACNQDCLCPFCLSSKDCPTEKHKQHLQDFDQECFVQKAAQCQDHWVNHPESFNEKKDVLVEKNVFYHNGVLVNEPRKYAVEKLKFAGIPKICISCCENVTTHFKLHMVIHLQCKLWFTSAKNSF